MAQVPQAFKYQAVVRDADGNVLENHNVNLNFILIQDDGSGPVQVFSETHQATSNTFGLVNLKIGQGNLVMGDFAQIDWSQPTFFEIGMDPIGGTDFQPMGTSELLSVPYALYAANSGNNDADTDPTNELQVLSQNGSDITLSNNGGTVSINDPDADPTNELQVLSQNSSDITLSNNGGTISINDPDADPTNELQVLSQNGSDITLSNNGGTISINDPDADPNNELELPANPVGGDIVFFNGTSWQRLPKGKGGQVLTLGSNGNPVWNGPTTEDLLEVMLPNSEILYVHPSNNSDEIQWGGYRTDVTNLPNIQTFDEAIMDFNGAGNTSIITAELGDSYNYAAKLCYELEAYGFDDWYLPSVGEFHEMVKKLGYLSNGTGHFPFGWYWTSTEFNEYDSWIYIPRHDTSTASNIGKGNNGIICRCVRR